jgi:hypothetical protein
MSTKWEVYGCYIDGSYSVVRVDVGIDPEELPETVPTLMRIRAFYSSRDSRGMPGKTELKLLRQVGESLTKSSASDGAICVGWLTSDGHRDHFLYGNEHGLQAVWNHVSGEFQTIDMTSELAEEPDWRTYHELLYPNELTGRSFGIARSRRDSKLEETMRTRSGELRTSPGSRPSLSGQPLSKNSKHWRLSSSFGRWRKTNASGSSFRS